MACLICGSKVSEPVFAYIKPDKYEEWQGIWNVLRKWSKCSECDFHFQTRNYDLQELEWIYKEGYRSKTFRGESIESAFNRISKKSTENDKRVNFVEYAINLADKTVLDIGAGIGIFANSVKDDCMLIECVEENKHSLKFIQNNLGIRCYDYIPEANYDVTTLIHILEHITKPDQFLQRLKKMTQWLFIEVPDVAMFEIADQDHDDFNSCHLWSFGPDHLIKLVERNGFNFKEIRRPFYPGRNLRRIWAVFRT